MANQEEAILPLLDRLIDVARDAGARGVEVMHRSWRGSSLTVRRGRVTQNEPPQGTHLECRVYLPDGRNARCSLDSDAFNDAAAAITSAVAAAADAAPDPLGAPVERYTIQTRGLGIEDVRFAYVDRAAREEVALLNEESCESIDGVVAEEVTYTDQLTQRAFASTRGVQVVSRDTLYQVQLMARDRGSDRRLSHTASARNFANVGSMPFGVALAKRVADLRGGGAHPGEALPLVFEPHVLAVVLERIAPAFSSEAVERGESFLALHPDRSVGSRRVHLIDDPGLHGGLLTRAFDDRGVPPMALPLIKEGAPGRLFYAPEAARRLDLRPSGHFIDDALRPSNLILRPGNRSRTQMLSEVPRSLCFDHIEGTIDPTTGAIDVSGPAFLLEKGRRVGVIESVRVQTDIYALLGGVQELASNQTRTEAVDCATALIVGVGSA